ncbi:MAG: cysteine-rich KTR domain-containing protein [Oscillospiraceae bacterium]|nr:cysteine-rich KTR domain-containing protein [Oscillospiraceae bacterium]
MLCPICNGKPRTKMYPDTVLTDFPLFCQKCKWETIIRLNRQDKHTKICTGKKYGTKEWEVKW